MNNKIIIKYKNNFVIIFSDNLYKDFLKKSLSISFSLYTINKIQFVVLKIAVIISANLREKKGKKKQKDELKKPR